jgi:hypothetical protein
MVTVDELKTKFPVRDVAPYGQCIVVPGDEFDPDWEAELDEQGYSIIETDFGDPAKPVTLVKLKSRMKADSPKEVYHPEPNALPQKRKQPVAPWQDPSRRWKAEEDELIIALWNQKHNIPEIHTELRKRFPNRSIHAVKCRVTRLIKAGKIPGRWHKGTKQKKSKAKVATEPESAKPNVSQTSPKSTPKAPDPSTAAHTAAHTPVHTPVPFSIKTTLTIQLSVNCNDRNAVANLFDIIEKMGLRKKEASG